MSSLNQKDFLERVLETRLNVEGVRSPTDHLRRLAPDIVALRNDGVSWRWITSRFNAGRTGQQPLTVRSVRTLWARAVKDQPELGKPTHLDSPKTQESDLARTGNDDWLDALVEREKGRERRHEGG